MLAIALVALLAAAPDAGDDVRLITATPAGPVPRGVETEFTLEIEYTLESIESGVLIVGFNSDRNPMAFRQAAVWPIRHGTDRITVKASAIPVDWGDRGTFGVILQIGPKRDASSWQPLANRGIAIPVEASPTPLPAAVDPGPPSKADVSSFGDVVEVVGVEPPGAISRGVPTELTIDVSYTLASRDDGVLNIAFNSRSPNTYDVVEHREVAKGSDRIQIKAKVMPVDWGELGTFQLWVGLGAPSSEKGEQRMTAVVTQDIPTSP